MIQTFKNFIDKRKQASILSTSKTVCDKKANKDTRFAAIEKLSEYANESDDALEGLIDRLNITIDHSILDKREKEFVQDILINHEARSIPLLKKHIAKRYHIAWYVNTLKRLSANYIDDLLSALTFDDIIFSKEQVEKNLEIITMLRPVENNSEEIRKKIFDAVATFLKDRDERVRLAAVEVLALQMPDRACTEIAHYIDDNSPENSRLRNRVIHIFKEYQWRVPNHKKYKGGKISDNIFINNKGIIQTVGS